MNTAVRSAALAAALCCIAGVTRAHAPLPRGLAVAPNDSGAIALRMPGFGWLLRDTDTPKAEPTFAYACDALLGVSPIEERVPMAYRHDGTLLVGTGHGVRMLSSDGCPTGGAPLDVPIAALAVHASEQQRAYAVTRGVDLPPYAYRSDDGGESWTLAGPLAAYDVTALVLDPSDPEKLYVSQTTGTQRSQIAVSSDGGASFDTFQQDRDLTLLYIQENPTRLWATTRVVGQNHGVTLLRAAQADGPWQELLTVNFFGGFAVDPNDSDVIWVGDEARGVFRSTDGGDTFDETQPDVATSCLAYGAGALWACTPGLPDETALARSPDAVARFKPVMAFADVDHLIDCSPAIDVEKVCAPAWVEWRRDILALPPLMPDAGVPDAGLNDAGSVAAQDAAIQADAAVVDAARAASGCSVFTPRSATQAGWRWMCALIGLLALGGYERALQNDRAICTRYDLCMRPMCMPGASLRARLVSDRVPLDSQPSESALSTPLDDDEFELIARAQQGDVDAFASLYDRHAPIVLALGQRMLSSLGDAQDLLHDVFIEAWQSVREYAPDRASVRTWLLVRMRSRALDRIARHGREQQARRALTPAMAQAPHLERGFAVREALAELDDDVRSALELSYFMGLTAREISERTQVPEGTVRSRLARGLQRLQQTLSDVRGTRHGA